jgi:antitoxin component HigA of HigAB toxin-antitoxin module
MGTRSICSDDDHEKALREIEGLMGAPAGSSEGERLEALVAMVEAYEARRYLG